LLKSTGRLPWEYEPSRTEGLNSRHDDRVDSSGRIEMIQGNRGGAVATRLTSASGAASFSLRTEHAMATP
jgi:hypothetical protein